MLGVLSICYVQSKSWGHIINITIRNKPLIKEVDTIALNDSKLLYQ